MTPPKPPSQIRERSRRVFRGSLSLSRADHRAHPGEDCPPTCRKSMPLLQALLRSVKPDPRTTVLLLPGPAPSMANRWPRGRRRKRPPAFPALALPKISTFVGGILTRPAPLLRCDLSPRTAQCPSRRGRLSMREIVSSNGIPARHADETILLFCHIDLSASEFQQEAQSRWGAHPPPFQQCCVPASTVPLSS